MMFQGVRAFKHPIFLVLQQPIIDRHLFKKGHFFFRTVDYEVDDFETFDYFGNSTIYSIYKFDFVPYVGVHIIAIECVQ